MITSKLLSFFSYHQRIKMILVFCHSTSGKKYSSIIWLNSYKKNMHINIYQIQYMAWKCSDMMKGQIMTECVLSIRFEKGSTPWSSDNMMFQALGNCYGPIVQLEIEFPDCPIPLFSSEKTVWKISFISLDFYHIFSPSILLVLNSLNSSSSLIVQMLIF